MPLTALDYDLKPNIYDNKQRSWDPEGTWREDEGPSLPTLTAPYGVGVSDITSTTAKVSWSITGNEHTSIELQLWVDNVSTTWDEYSLVGDKDAREVVLNTLPENYGFKVRLRTIYEDGT